MIELPLVITPQSVPANYEPPDDMQGLLEAVPEYTTYVLNDDGANVTINATGGADFNGIWAWDLSAQNQPFRLMTGYRNSWWPLYTGMPGEIRMMVTPPAGYFDGSGRGLQNSGWDGWCLCNGQNGTVNLNNLFVVPGYRYDGTAWVTNVDNKDAYSNPKSPYFQIALDNFPGMTGNMPIGFTLFLQYTNFFKTNQFNSGEYSTIVDPQASTTQGTYFWTVYPMDESDQMIQYPVSILPPYIALGYVQFMGYL
jgi:hypothetical protein